MELAAQRDNASLSHGASGAGGKEEVNVLSCFIPRDMGCYMETIDT